MGPVTTGHFPRSKWFLNWRCIKQDDEGKQLKFKMDIAMTAFTSKAAVNEQWLSRAQAEVRCYERIVTEDDLRRCED